LTLPVVKSNQRDSPDKAKPSVRRGQKAAGLSFCSKMAELPKDETFGGSAILLVGGLRESRTLTANIRGEE
jgi:hypothetical protein